MATRAEIQAFDAEVQELLGSEEGWAYAYNGMEVCRSVNGHEPHDHKGCHFTTQEKDWGQPKGGCRYRERGCELCQRTVLSRLMSLQRRGGVKSIKIRWFDSRNPGVAEGGFTFDMFRIFYAHREGLARRLVQDIDCTMGVPVH